MKIIMYQISACQSHYNMCCPKTVYQGRRQVFAKNRYFFPARSKKNKWIRFTAVTTLD